MKITELKINPNNPQRFNDLSKLENSIKEFPKMMELRALVVDNNNMVLGGNKRLVCLQNLGFKEIPDTWVKHAKDLTKPKNSDLSLLTMLALVSGIGMCCKNGMSLWKIGGWKWWTLITQIKIRKLM